jgi:hypothetical protein
MANEIDSLIGMIIGIVFVWWAYKTLKVSKQKGTSTTLYWVVIVLCGCGILSNFVSLFRDHEEPQTKIIFVEKKDENKSS